jgi:rhamnosyltransferase subunit B
MSRIVLTTLGSLGDLHPFIALALGLRDRGHSVVIATVKDYQAKVESLGLEFHSIRPDHVDLEDPEMLAIMMDLKNGTEWILRNYILGSIRETYADLSAIAKDADLIIAHEIIYAAPLVAEILQIRWISCTLSPVSFFSAYDPPVLPIYSALAKLRGLGPGVNRWVVKFAKFVTRNWGEPLQQFRQELGLAPAGNPIIDDKFSPYLVLALFPSVLGQPQPDWPNQVLVTGSTLYDGKGEQQLDPALQDFLDGGEPPLVFTLGSAAVHTPGDFYQQSVAAAQQLNRRAVLLIGNNPPPAHLSDRIVAFDYAPYSEIFPRAAAIVHQGGIGTTSQGLRSGHPTIVMPYSHDQPDNAARLERLGVSRTIPRQQYSADRAVKELRELLANPSYQQQAAKIGQMLQSENGVKVACEAIEKQLLIGQHEARSGII